MKRPSPAGPRRAAKSQEDSQEPASLSHVVRRCFSRGNQQQKQSRPRKSLKNNNHMSVMRFSERETSSIQLSSEQDRERSFCSTEDEPRQQLLGLHGGATLVSHSTEAGLTCQAGSGKHQLTKSSSDSSASWLGLLALYMLLSHYSSKMIFITQKHFPVVFKK